VTSFDNVPQHTMRMTNNPDSIKLDGAPAQGIQRFCIERSWLADGNGRFVPWHRSHFKS
jgi:hypothetical protein